MKRLSLHMLLGPTTALILSATALGQNGWVPVVDVKASSTQGNFAFLSPQNVISNEGLTESPPGSGQYKFSRFANNWVSAYGQPNDDNALIHFEFDRIRTVDRFRVWNCNENTPFFNGTFRGIKDVTVQASNDGQRWWTLTQRFVFQRGPGSDDYFGNLYTFDRPVTAKFIRFAANSTYTGFGFRDVAALGRVRFFEGGEPTPPPTETGPFPRALRVANVKEAPYFAKGDGRTDDTEAIQRAIRDVEGTGRTLYLPEGVYLVSRPLAFRSNTSQTPAFLFGRNNVMGAGELETVIRLRPGSLPNAAQPQPVIDFGQTSFWNGEFEQNTADWFHNSIENLTIDVTTGNPGAKGLQFYSNNTGVVRNVRIVSRDGQGAIGLELGHADQNGPLLVDNVRVHGFNVGVNSGFTVNSMTFDQVTLVNQRDVAFLNNGQCVAVRRLTVRGAAQPFRNGFGSSLLMDSNFRSTLETPAHPAIVNGEYLTVFNVRTAGYTQGVRSTFGGGPDFPGRNVGEWTNTGQVLSLFPNGEADFPAASSEATDSELPDGPVLEWANIRDFRWTDDPCDAASFARASASGARVLFVPFGERIVLRNPATVSGSVERVLGFKGTIEEGPNGRIVVTGGAPEAVQLDGMFNVRIEHRSPQALKVRDSEASVTALQSGNVYLDNVVGLHRFEGPMSVYGRQVNSEVDGTKISVDGSKLWILGFKTERGGTLIDARNGASIAIFGGLCYTVTPGDQPMFRLTDSNAWLTIGEVAYGIPPFASLVEETRNGVTRSLLRGQAPFRFSFMNGSALPLFRSVR